MRIIKEGVLTTGERFVCDFTDFTNNKLIDLLNKTENGNYSKNKKYLSIRTYVYDEYGNCWGFPRNNAVKNKWLELLGYKDIGCNLRVYKLIEFTNENIENFLNEIGAIVEKEEIRIDE